MAFFEHVLGGVLYPPAYYYSFKHISKMSKATDFKFVVRVHVDIFSKRTSKNPVKVRGLGHVTCYKILHSDI